MLRWSQPFAMSEKESSSSSSDKTPRELIPSLPEKVRDQIQLAIQEAMSGVSTSGPVLTTELKVLIQSAVREEVAKAVPPPLPPAVSDSSSSSTLASAD